MSNDGIYFLKKKKHNSDISCKKYHSTKYTQNNVQLCTHVGKKI